MEETGLHSGLEMRLTALATRIAALRQKMSHAKAPEKIEEFGEIEGLERRYKVLEDQLRKLNGEGPGFRQDMKAEIEKVADDLTSTVEEFVTWVDSGYRPDQRPKRLHKS
jgi:predicted  nucleic acid-binding Zn-ribbon protein